MTDKVSIRHLPTNVPGLDQILGGGVPEFSFNLIAGAPGSGKTTLAHQIMFSLVGPGCRALYFTVVGEPPLKMLRYQQQYEFFDSKRLDESIRFVNLSQEVGEATLDKLFARITAEVEATQPTIVFVDSFRAVARAVLETERGDGELQHFAQRLATTMTGWQATTFLIGEYQPRDADSDPVFTVADGVLWLHQSLDRNSMVRKIQVMKMRGQAPVPGLHTFRITLQGIQVFPRVIVDNQSAAKQQARRRLTTDNAVLDEMLGGGIPAGYSVLVAGPSGSGKSVIATEFIMAGVRHDEPGVLAVFEKRPNEYSQTPPGGRAFAQMVRDGKVGVIHTRPLDLSIDETLYEIVEQIGRMKARRLVVDSLSGFELALAPTFREDFRESLYRMVSVLTGMGVTMMMTAELEDSYTDLRFSPHGTAFLTDIIIMQRYIELKGCLQRVMSVVKVRGSAHSKEIRAFEITKSGIVVRQPLASYDGLLTGHPEQPVTVAPAIPPRRRARNGKS
ncbi:MAG TPA: ATPase domain-containing protein [Thermoanaerobaculia bacterium]|jgi:circadian clock protein KaiC|nr:ATPase domain-containing protein [Thermoanaerobaculia bacterium]